MGAVVQLAKLLELRHTGDELLQVLVYNALPCMCLVHSDGKFILNVPCRHLLPDPSQLVFKEVKIGLPSLIFGEAVLKSLLELLSRADVLLCGYESELEKLFLEMAH
jgi:hypothetical protein